MGKNTDDYEFAEEWENRDEELRDISLEDYNESRCVEEYGSTKEDMDSGDDD